MDRNDDLDADVARTVFGFWFEEDGERGPQWWGPHSHTPGARAYATACLPLWVMGCSYRASNGLPYFSSDATACAAVVEEIKRRPFSVRHRFIEALREQMPRPAGAMIDSSWWVFFMTPEIICRAALACVQEPAP